MKDSSKEWTPDQEETSAWTFRLLKSQSLPFEFKEIAENPQRFSSLSLLLQPNLRLLLNGATTFALFPYAVWPFALSRQCGG